MKPKKPSLGQPAALLAWFILVNASFSAEQPAPPGLNAQTRPVLVGDLGRREALRIEGNQTFTKEQILDAMLLHIDYHLAAHPEAPLAVYAARLERKITLGYQHSGFPDAIVRVAPDTNSHQMMVRVTEGPRYRCGELLLSGVKTMTNAAVRQKILDTLSGLEPGQIAQTNLGLAFWNRDKPAPFDEFSQKQLADMVDKALAELDYYQPKVKVRIVPDPARKLAKLQVEIADEGIKGTIAEIAITGLHTNTRQQVLDYLKLQPGMEMRASLAGSVSNQLGNSGRFLHHDVMLHPQPQAGKFKLELDLEELRAAPPLNQEFSPKARAMLKFRDWLLDRENHAEDLVLSAGKSNDWLRIDVEAALSASGFVLATRMSLSNEPPQLKYAFVASEKQVGFYSPWRRSKYTFQAKGRELSAFISMTPNTKPGDKGEHQLTVGAGLKPREGGALFRVNMDLHPTAFITENPSNSYSLKDGVLQITGPRESGHGLEVQLDAATGRLIQLLLKQDDAVTMRVHPEAGVFARLVKEIATVTADHPNDYHTNREFSSMLSFFATDLIESPLTERLLQGLIEEFVPEARQTNALAALNKIKPVLAQAREVFNQQDFASVFEPLNRLTADKEEGDDEDTFIVPLDNVMADYRANPMLMLTVGALIYSDQLLTRDSWPWILVREAAFTLAGQGQYAQAELDKLLKSDETGPLGYLATARLLGKMNPKLARAFAERGLARLTSPDFRKDYGILLQSDSVASETLAAMLGLVRSLNEAQTTALATNLPQNEAALARQLAQLIRAGKGQPAGAAAWPAFEQYWDKAMRGYLEAGLNRFLPQFQFLTNSVALYQRGLTLVAPNAVLQDFEEAAQCFRKAAEQGHPGAQMNLGLLYERGQGVRVDPEEAMRWYRKAAEQKEPHATCRIGELYQNGKGVTADPDEAAKWYRIEAEGSCSGAQAHLGQIYESQNKLPEALKWYRRAAEAGNAEARAHLGDVLSDDFFMKPDYVEACQWLMLAAQEGDKVSEIRLRRVKARLSAEQLAEVQKRADAISLKADAERGNARAQYDLGDAYRKGNGVVKDEAEAVKWYRKAAEQNYAEAQFRLGTFYSRQGVTNDYVEAVNWYRKAAEQNLASAQYSLGLSYRKGHGVVKDEVEALKWYRKAAEANLVVGQASLARLLATSNDPAIRDGSNAVVFAEKAVAATSRKSPGNLDTLAAAYAETGQFEKAVSAQKEAIALLKTEKEKQEYTSRLKLYEAKTPYRTKD